MTLNLPDVAAVADAATISPLALFLQADIVVKGVMLGLLLASIWTWAIIIGFSVSLRRASKESRKFEADFWKAEDIDRFYETRGKVEHPAAKVMAAGVTEWRRSTAQKVVDRDGTRDRLATAMSSTIAAEIDRQFRRPRGLRDEIKKSARHRGRERRTSLVWLFRCSCSSETVRSPKAEGVHAPTTVSGASTRASSSPLRSRGDSEPNTPNHERPLSPMSASLRAGGGQQLPACERYPIVVW